MTNECPLPSSDRTESMRKLIRSGHSMVWDISHQSLCVKCWEEGGTGVVVIKWWLNGNRWERLRVTCPKWPDGREGPKTVRGAIRWMDQARMEAASSKA